MKKAFNLLEKLKKSNILIFPKKNQIFTNFLKLVFLKGYKVLYRELCNENKRGAIKKREIGSGDVPEYLN